MTVEAPAAPATPAAPVTPAAAAPVVVTPAVTPATPAAAAPAAAPATPAAPAAAKPGEGQPASLLEAPAEPAKPGEPKPGEKTQGAPEAYTDFKLPDGLAPDAPLLDKFKATAKELGLSQENAQKLVTLQAEHAKSTAETLVAQAEQQRNTQIQAWQAETKKQLGAEWQKELGFASKALDAFWTPEMRKTLTQSGLGDHPGFVAGLVKLGKSFAEAAPGVGSRSGIVDPKEATNRSMFPKMYDADGNYIGGQK